MTHNSTINLESCSHFRPQGPITIARIFAPARCLAQFHCAVVMRAMFMQYTAKATATARTVRRAPRSCRLELRGARVRCAPAVNILLHRSLLILLSSVIIFLQSFYAHSLSNAVHFPSQSNNNEKRRISRFVGSSRPEYRLGPSLLRAGACFCLFCLLFVCFVWFGLFCFVWLFFASLFD